MEYLKFFSFFELKFLILILEREFRNGVLFLSKIKVLKKHQNWNLYQV